MVLLAGTIDMDVEAAAASHYHILPHLHCSSSSIQDHSRPLSADELDSTNQTQPTQHSKAEFIVFNVITSISTYYPAPCSQNHILQVKVYEDMPISVVKESTAHHIYGQGGYDKDVLASLKTLFRDNNSVVIKESPLSDNMSARKCAVLLCPTYQQQAAGHSARACGTISVICPDFPTMTLDCPESKHQGISRVRFTSDPSDSPALISRPFHANHGQEHRQINPNGEPNNGREGSSRHAI